MRRRRYQSREQNRNEILFTEFKFYNKTKNVIEKDVLDEIEKTLRVGKKDTIFWTNKTFADHSIGFKFRIVKYPKIEGEKQKAPSLFVRIVELGHLKFTAEQFCNAEEIMFDGLFFGYKMSEEQKEFLSDLVSYNDLNSRLVTKDVKTMKCWDDVVCFLIENNMLNWYEQETYWSTFRKEAELLFPELKLEQPRYHVIKSNYYSSRESVKHIIKVVERRINKKNYRIALTASIYYSEPEYTFYVVNEDSPDYICLDENRLYFTGNNRKKYFLDMSLTQTADGKVIMNQGAVSLLSRNIENMLNAEQNVIPPMIYNFYAERATKYSEDDLSYFDEKQMKINEQYRKLIERGKTIKIGDLRINKKMIALDNEDFIMEFDEEFINTVEHFNKVRKCLEVRDAQYNFNTIYENLLKISKLKVVDMEWVKEHEYKNFKGVKFKVNGMLIEVYKDGSRMKINGIFCRINDVFHILTKVICYRDVKEFNKYVKDVSHIGIEWKQMISSGILIELQNPFFSIFKKTGQSSLEKMHLRFSLLWDANRRTNIYLLLNNEQYLIKYKGKFKRLFNYPRRVITMSQLRNELHECIESIDDDRIIEIVENALEEAKIIQKRGEELVANTVKEVGAEEIEMEIRGDKMIGFKLVGRLSGTEYFVRKNDLAVFKLTNDSWNQRCVVDDHTKQRIFEDRLANRLVNIYNEPKKIFTLHN